MMLKAATLSSNASALRRFTSCDIGDALVRLGVPYGGFLSGIQMHSPERQSGTRKIFGPAYTIQMVEAQDNSAPKPSIHFADGVPKDSVVFISQPKGMYSACWGGLMSTRAKYLGAQGVVIDGNFRDVNEHRELNFPLFAKGSSILGSNTFTRSVGLNVPVSFSSDLQPKSITIHPGDLILGDADGVVVIPPKLLEQCLNLCEVRFLVDEETKKCLDAGEEMGPTIQKLRK